MKTEACEPLLSWTIIDGVHIPSFQRKDCEFIPVRLVESTLLRQYPDSQTLRDSPLDGHFMTAAEAAVLNSATSDEVLNSGTDEVAYSTADLVVKLTDFRRFYQKVKEHFGVDCGPDYMTGGWLQLNNVVLPYVVRDTSKVIPLDIIRLGGKILVDVDMREFELCPSDAERVFLNNSLKLCGFDYRLEENMSKLVDLTVVWLFCSLNSTRLTVRELPGKDPLSEAGYDDFEAAEFEDHTSGTPSPILSDDSGIDVARGQADVKPILIKPIERCDSIICLFDDECSEEILSCQDSAVSHDVNTTEAAQQNLHSIPESRCDEQQPPVSGVPKRKRASPLGSKKDKSKLRKVSAAKLPDTNNTYTTGDANNTHTTNQNSASTLTSPSRDIDNSRTMSFENSNVAGRPPVYPSAPNNYAVNWLDENRFNGCRYASLKAYRPPLPGLARFHPTTSGQYHRPPEPNRQHSSLSHPPPLAAISGTILDERNLGTNNPTMYHPYDTASRAKHTLNPPSQDAAGCCVNGSGISSSQRNALLRQQSMARTNGPYYREMMTSQNTYHQNIHIPSQHTSGGEYYENNYILNQIHAQNNDSDVGLRSRPFDTTNPAVNYASLNSNRITRPHDGNRTIHPPPYANSIHTNGTPYYQSPATGYLPGNSYLPPVANGVGRAVASGPAVPGMIRARNSDQLQSRPMPSAYPNQGHQIPQIVHTIVPCTRSGNSESQFHVPARQNTNFSSRTMMSSVQQQQQQQRSARMNYLNSQSVSTTSRMLEMHQRQGLHRPQVSTYGTVPPQPNTTASAVSTSQVDSRASRYGFTKPWKILDRLANSAMITAHVVGKEVICAVRPNGIFAPLESLHELLFAEYYSLDDWLYMMNVTFAADTIELSDEEEQAFGLYRSRKIQYKRAISLKEFYKHLEHFGMR